MKKLSDIQVRIIELTNLITESKHIPIAPQDIESGGVLSSHDRAASGIDALVIERRNLLEEYKRRINK